MTEYSSRYEDFILEINESRKILYVDLPQVD